MNKEEKIASLKATVEKLKDEKMTIEIAIMGLESQIKLEELYDHQ